MNAEGASVVQALADWVSDKYGLFDALEAAGRPLGVNPGGPDRTLHTTLAQAVMRRVAQMLGSDMRTSRWNLPDVALPTAETPSVRPLSEAEFDAALAPDNW